MIEGIYFNEETKSYSLIESQEEFADHQRTIANKIKVGTGKALRGTKKAAKLTGNHIMNHHGVYITGGTTVAGAAAGTVIAKKNAEKQAVAAGLAPGSKEYKKFVRSKAAVGGAIGAGAGATVSIAAQTGIGIAKAKPVIKVLDRNKKGELVRKPKVNWKAVKSGAKAGAGRAVGASEINTLVKYMKDKAQARKDKRNAQNTSK